MKIWKMACRMSGSHFLISKFERMEILKADEISINLSGNNILENVSFTIRSGEQWAVTGPSGSGKTTLLKALIGRQFFSGNLLFYNGAENVNNKIVLVEQQHHFRNLSNTNNFYYQQRFNSHDAGDAITVNEYLQTALSGASGSKDELDRLVALFNVKKLFNEPLIQLSNGENKRLQIIKALLQHPAFLLLDNPFIGLDVNSRHDLEKILDDVGKSGVHIIMVTSPNYMPFFVTNVLSLQGDGSYAAGPIIPGQWNATHQNQP